MARRIVWGALIAGILGVTAFTLPSYFLYILSLAGIWAIAAIGLDLLTGVAGQISIGHAGFMAIGAYTVALLSLRLEAPFWLALPAAGLLNALIGLALGLPALRLSGPYLAIATLGFGVAVVEILRRWEPVTGGFMGLKVPPPALGPWSLRSDAAQYLLIGTLLVLLAGIAIRLIRSPFGRAWIALRDREAAAQAANQLFEKAGGNMGIVLITHYSRILHYIRPHHVHVMLDGRIVISGGPELADELEQTGYEGLQEQFAEVAAATPGDQPVRRAGKVFWVAH